MSNELINLLPYSQRKLFRRNYFIRVGIVVIVLIAIVVGLNGIFLIPTYIFLNQDVATKNLELDRLSKSQTTEEQKAEAEATALQTEAVHLTSLGKSPTASAVLQAILAVPHPGIILQGFTYTPPDQQGKGVVEVTGTASTRESLRSYNQSLSALPFITNADLPISDYASESDISFTITLTGVFTQS